MHLPLNGVIHGLAVQLAIHLAVMEKMGHIIGGSGQILHPTFWLIAHMSTQMYTTLPQMSPP